jgi:hypothetical protein
MGVEEICIDELNTVFCYDRLKRFSTEYASGNPLIDSKFLRNDPKRWRMEWLTCCLKEGHEFMIERKNWCWNFEQYCNRSDVDLDFVSKYWRLTRFRGSFLSANSSISPSMMKRYKNIPWEVKFFSSNRSANLYQVKELKMIPLLDMRRYSSNPVNDLDTVLSNPDIKWDMEWFSSNPSLTFEQYIKHRHLPWDEKNLSSNSTFPTKFFIENCGGWDGKSISRRRNLTIEDVLLTTDMFDIKEITENPAIPVTTLLFHEKQLNVDRKILSRNDNIKGRDVVDSPDGWDYVALSANTFGLFYTGDIFVPRYRHKHGCFGMYVDNNTFENLV